MKAYGEFIVTSQETRFSLTSAALHTAVRLSYADVFGKPATRQHLVEILQRLRLSEIADYLGRASAIVYNAPVADEAVQRQLCDVFFGANAGAVWSAVARFSQVPQGQMPWPPVVLFDEASIALTFKVALFSAQPDGASTEVGISALGEAILIANSLMDSNAPLHLKRNNQKGLDAWVYYEYTVSAFQANDQTLHKLARTYELFLTDRPSLSGSSSYMNLSDRVESATGLDSLTLWSILIAYFSHFYSINASNAHRSAAWIHKETYFQDYRFTKTQVRSFLDLLARPVGDLTSEVRSSMSMNALRPFDHAHLAKSPLIEVDDRVYCPVLRLLVERVTTGLYHTLLNATPGHEKTSANSRAQFMRYIGDVFEDYVDRLINRAVDERSKTGLNDLVYLDPRTLRGAAPATKQGEDPPICDHLIWDGSNLIVWDSKAKSFPAEVRAGENQEQFIERFGGLVDGAARQLHSTVELARNGAFDSLGVDSRKIRAILPAIVSLPDHTVQPDIHAWIQLRLSKQGLLPRSYCNPLEVILAGDLEQLESWWAGGKNLGEFLRRKSDSQQWHAQSIHNYIALGGDPDLENARSPYLDGIYKSLTSKVEAFMAASAR